MQGPCAPTSRSLCTLCFTKYPPTWNLLVCMWIYPYLETKPVSPCDPRRQAPNPQGGVGEGWSAKRQVCMEFSDEANWPQIQAVKQARAHHDWFSAKRPRAPCWKLRMLRHASSGAFPNVATPEPLTVLHAHHALGRRAWFCGFLFCRLRINYSVLEIVF